MFDWIRRLFRIKKKTVQEELDDIVKRLDDAYAKYERNPNRYNTLYFDGLLDITERLVSNLEKIEREALA